MKWIGFIFFLIIQYFNVNICSAVDSLTLLEKENMLSIARERNSTIKQDKLEKFLISKDNLTKFLLLPLLSITCIENEDYQSAEKYALEMLSYTEFFQENWNFGNVIHDGNMIRGIISLHDNNIKDAKKYLLQAGLAPMTPQIGVYGPNMMLADALLDVGEVEVVKSYLTSLKKSWIKNDGRIDSWIAAINGGGRPYFGLNLPTKYKKQWNDSRDTKEKHME